MRGGKSNNTNSGLCWINYSAEQCAGDIFSVGNSVCSNDEIHDGAKDRQESVCCTVKHGELTSVGCLNRMCG